MASGEKLPNTNLNLIQDSDLIDNADINAIAQAVEATTIAANRTAVSTASPSVLDWAMQPTNGLHFFATDSGTTDVPGVQFKYSPGVLMVRTAGHRTVVIISYSTGRVISNTYINNEWGGWKDPGRQEDPVEAVLTADKFDTDSLKLYRIGRLCVTTGSFKFTQEIPTGGYHTLGSVPEGFRPPVNVQTWSSSQMTKDMVTLVVQPNGGIIAYNYSPNPLPLDSRLTANLTWITNG